MKIEEEAILAIRIGLAAVAMHALLSKPDSQLLTMDSIVAAAYKAADAMMKIGMPPGAVE